MMIVLALVDFTIGVGILIADRGTLMSRPVCCMFGAYVVLALAALTVSCIDYSKAAAAGEITPTVRNLTYRAYMAIGFALLGLGGLLIKCR
jgi:hypothetical protein